MITKSRHWYSIKRMIPGGLYEPLLDSYYNFRTLMYSGNEVHCPICDKSFKQFIGGHACPYCGSGKRHRLLYLFLQKRTNFFSTPLKVLHFAPEHCFYKRFARLKNLEYVSADLNSPRAMQKIDMTNIQYPDDHFDVVISSHVLEHIPDDRKAMKELVRIMKKEGWAIHQAPINYTYMETFEDSNIQTNEERLKFYGHIDHKRIYGNDYVQRLRESGFIVTVEDVSAIVPESQVQQFGLDITEKMHYCRK